MDNYKVYIHIFPNNKVYIGITKQKPENRWNNGRGYKNNDYLVNAILKYGWDNIEHKILYNNLSKEEAEQKEIYLIKKYKANKKRYGYNILDGGNVSDGMTEEVRKKIGEASKGRIPPNKGKKMSDEFKKKLSEGHKGQIVSEEKKQKLREFFKGREFSKETRNKISIAKKGQPSKLRRKVICIETNKIYNSVTEAEIELKIRHICEACNKIRKTAGGYHWQYVKEM